MRWFPCARHMPTWRHLTHYIISTISTCNAKVDKVLALNWSLSKILTFYQFTQISSSHFTPNLQFVPFPNQTLGHHRVLSTNVPIGEILMPSRSTKCPTCPRTRAKSQVSHANAKKQMSEIIRVKLTGFIHYGSTKCLINNLKASTQTWYTSNPRVKTMFISDPKVVRIKPPFAWLEKGKWITAKQVTGPNVSTKSKIKKVKHNSWWHLVLK